MEPGCVGAFRRDRSRSELLSPYYVEPAATYLRLSDGTIVRKELSGTRFRDLAEPGSQEVLTYFLDGVPDRRSTFGKYDLYPILSREALRDWWNDWGVTLRPRYGLREQLRLGLTLGKRRGSSSGDEGLDDEDGDPADGPDRPLTTADSLVAS